VRNAEEDSVRVSTVISQTSELGVAYNVVLMPNDMKWTATDEEKLKLLRAAIDEGDASGIAEGDVFAQVRAKLGLPPRSERGPDISRDLPERKS
jgi:hypothetical protein